MGSVGGVGLNHPSVITVSPHQVADPSHLTTRLSAIDRFPNPVNDVVIVVADDFGKAHNRQAKSVYTVDQSLFNLGLESLRSTAEDTSADFEKALKDKLDHLLMSARLSHGALTFNMLIDMLLNVPGVSAQSVEPERVIFKFSKARITLQATEVSGLDTPQIKDVLEDTLNHYTKEGVTQFVFNFSFTLEPCTKSNEQRPTQTTSAFIKSMVNDPLYKFIHDTNRATKTTKLFLASAGNNGQKAAAQPANWPAVVGVSASKVRPLNSAEDELRARFSNYGEVMAPGSWLELTDPLNRNRVGRDAPEVVVEGSSFSVLLATLFSALDLTQASPKCGLHKNSTSPKLAQSGDINRTLKSAVIACQRLGTKF